MYKASALKADGIKPLPMATKLGCTINISNKKERPIITTKEIINRSSNLMPLFIKNKSKMVSSTEIEMPTIKGMPNNNCKPMAIPIISARSQADMAISAKMYNGILMIAG